MSQNITPKVDSPDSEQPANPKAAAELKKLQLEAEKIELEIKHLRRPPIRHPSAFIPILTSLIALSGVAATLWVTAQQKNQAVAAKNEAVAEKTQAVEAKKEAEAETQGQASYATSLERELQQAQVTPPNRAIAL